MYNLRQLLFSLSASVQIYHQSARPRDNFQAVVIFVVTQLPNDLLIMPGFPVTKQLFVAAPTIKLGFLPTGL